MSPLVARVSFVLFDLPVVFSECDCTLFYIVFLCAAVNHCPPCFVVYSERTNYCL